jgi:hypothetical protein
MSVDNQQQQEEDHKIMRNLAFTVLAFGALTVVLILLARFLT